MTYLELQKLDADSDCENRGNANKKKTDQKESSLAWKNVLIGGASLVSTASGLFFLDRKLRNLKESKLNRDYVTLNAHIANGKDHMKDLENVIKSNVGVK